MQNLLQLAPQVTDPIARNVDGYWIISTSESGEGFGILFIPESTLPPHRIILNIEEIRNRYYVRSGNSFIEASHTMLEDMFGRRPKPNLILSKRFEHAGSGGKTHFFTVILGIENIGRGVAKSPFLEITVEKPYKISQFGVDGNGHFGLPILAGINNTRSQRYGSSQTIVIHPGITLDITAIRLELDISQSQPHPELIINYQIAAEYINTIKEKDTINVSAIPAKFNLMY